MNAFLISFDIHLLCFFIVYGSYFLGVCVFAPSLHVNLHGGEERGLFMRKRGRQIGARGVGGSLKSFNEPALTLMTGWVSDEN